MKTPISQSTAKTNAKKYNDYFTANEQIYKMKQPPTTPYTIRVDTEKLQSANSKTDAKRLRLRLAKIINNYLTKVK
jgi:hypothetical protein